MDAGEFFEQSGFLNAYWQADQALKVLSPQVQSAIQAYGNEVHALQEVQKRVIRPQWPTKFDAIDPNGPEAFDPPVREVAAATTQAAVAGVAPVVAPVVPGAAPRQGVHSTTGPIEPLLPPEKPKGVFGK